MRNAVGLVVLGLAALSASAVNCPPVKEDTTGAVTCKKPSCTNYNGQQYCIGFDYWCPAGSTCAIQFDLDSNGKVVDYRPWCMNCAVQ
jgi:hypothetical protein